MYKPRIEHAAQFSLAFETMYLVHVEVYDFAIFCFCIFLLFLIAPVVEQLRVIARPEQVKLDVDLKMKRILEENKTWEEDQARARGKEILFDSAGSLGEDIKAGAVASVRLPDNHGLGKHAARGFIGSPLVKSSCE